MRSGAGGKPPHPTRRRHGCGDYTSGLTADSTSISVEHPLLSVPWAHPPSQLQSALLCVHNQRAFTWKKLATSLVRLIILCIGWRVTPQVMAWILNWSCLYCKYIHYECINIYITCSLGPSFSFFILKLGLLSYSVCGDEANCTYSEECPGQHLCHHGDGYPQQIMSSWIHSHVFRCCWKAVKCSDWLILCFLGVF